jgi:hypothetical protein
MGVNEKITPTSATIRDSRSEKYKRLRSNFSFGLTDQRK